VGKRSGGAWPEVGAAQGRDGRTWHDSFTPRVFSGIQPSGGLTLGNYLGAIKRFVEMQDAGSHETVYCMVDLHAITATLLDPDTLRNNTRELCAGFIAAGIDPEKSILINQSQVPEHAQLAWIFNCIARMGWMGRMTQWKDKAGKNAEAASLGLLAYPALMAADILIYHATHVPVGEDQKQHLELTRDIATKFNHDYGVDFFPITEPVIEGVATRVMNLQDGTKKMSKSDPSDKTRINMTDDADTIAKKIRKGQDRPRSASRWCRRTGRPPRRAQPCEHLRRAGRDHATIRARPTCRFAVRPLQGGAVGSGGGQACADLIGDVAPDGRPRRDRPHPPSRRHPRPRDHGPDPRTDLRYRRNAAELSRRVCAKSDYSHE
jgi:tryptophanyl-tRNA synthetase